jgi:hypothetical protein
MVVKCVDLFVYLFGFDRHNKYLLKEMFFVLQYSLVILEEARSSLFPSINVGPEKLMVDTDKATESVTDLLVIIYWISPRAEDVTVCWERAVYQYKYKYVPIKF